MKEMNKETDQELIRLAFKYIFIWYSSWGCSKCQ